MARTKGPRRRLDATLVEEGLAADLREARGLIMAGRVLVNDRRVGQAGTAVRPDAVVRLRRASLRYASRGGLKLEAALARFAIDVRGRAVLDAGASTGGFTDCLLRHGAARVYAVDTGYGQLRGRLAQDPRVDNRERTNIADLNAERFEVPVDLCTVDLSYVSLTEALPQLTPLFRDAPEFVALVKPRFEGLAASDERNEAPLLKVLHRFVDRLAQTDLTLIDAMTSPIFGGRGSVEFLAHLGGSRTAQPDWPARVRADLAHLLTGSDPRHGSETAPGGRTGLTS